MTDNINIPIEGLIRTGRGYFINPNETQTIIDNNKLEHTLKRIYRNNPETGVFERGGWVEKAENLDAREGAWVADKAMVYDKARVFGNARVFGDARVGGEAGVGFGETINSGTYNDNNNRVICLMRPQFPFPTPAQRFTNNISSPYGVLMSATKDFDTQTQQTVQHGI